MCRDTSQEGSIERAITAGGCDSEPPRQKTKKGNQEAESRCLGLEMALGAQKCCKYVVEMSTPCILFKFPTWLAAFASG